MNRPDVRMVQNQEEISNREITGSEADAILAKYGYGNAQYTTRVENQPTETKVELSFEDMLRQQEEKKLQEERDRIAKLNSPQPITFNGNNGYDSEVKYTGSGDFGFKIQITTDMKLPKY